MLLYADKVKTNREAFTEKVKVIAAALRTDPDYLMAVMYAESKLDPAAVNPLSGASGLIQFLPSTAKALSTTVETIRQMNNLDQLNFVYKYFIPYVGKLKSYFDVYMAVFYPYAIGRPNDYIFGSQSSVKDMPQIIARQNPAIAQGKNVITVSDFITYLKTTIPESLHLSFFPATVTDAVTSVVNAAAEVVTKNPLPVLLAVIFFFI